MIRAAVIVVAAMMTGCGPLPDPRAGGAPTIPTPAHVMEAPEVLRIDDRNYRLETHWLTGVAAQEPLAGDVQLVAFDDTEPYRRDMWLDHVWVVRGDRTWAMPLELDSSGPAYAIAADVSGGPRWRCGAVIDVVARIRVGDDREYLIRSANQIIYCEDDY